MPAAAVPAPVGPAAVAVLPGELAQVFFGLGFLAMSDLAGVGTDAGPDDALTNDGIVHGHSVLLLSGDARERGHGPLRVGAPVLVGVVPAQRPIPGQRVFGGAVEWVVARRPAGD